MTKLILPSTFLKNYLSSFTQKWDNKICHIILYIRLMYIKNVTILSAPKVTIKKVPKVVNIKEVPFLIIPSIVSC